MQWTEGRCGEKIDAEEGWRKEGLSTRVTSCPSLESDSMMDEERGREEVKGRGRGEKKGGKD